MDLTYLKNFYGLRLDLIHVMFNLLLIKTLTNLMAAVYL